MMPNKSYILVILGLMLLLIYSASYVQGAYSPTLSSPAQTETTVTLQWTKSDDWIFSKYETFYSTSVNGPWKSFWSTDSKDQTSTFIGGLIPNTDYYFKVEDSGSLVGTTPSNTLQVRTKANPALEITSNTLTTASLRWIVYNTYSSSVPFKSYTIQMRTQGSSWSILTTSTDATQNTYTVTGLCPGTYEFQIIDKVGNNGQYSANSNVATLVIPEPTPEPTSAPLISEQWMVSPVIIGAIIFIIALVLIVVAALLITRRRK
ncbi:MAG: fibronectin type III domain-containing protein [Candidatus Bathyarchaeota archaeon]|nr:fibronectin type III domain-containing protein [Candidatus Bathyarchaeota archaeon]